MASSVVRRNALSLAALQWGSYALPLLVVPYLTRVLGVEGYGRLGFAQALAQYLVIATDYGFSLSATRLVAIARGDQRRVSSIFWATTFAKAGLALASAIVLLGTLVLVPALTADRSLLLAGFLSVIGTVLFPAWLFQGMERMGSITVVTLAARFTLIPMTFLLVKGPGDVTIALALQSGSALLAGVVASLVVWRWGIVTRSLVRGADVAEALREGWHVFLSMAAMSLYTASNAIVLRIAAGPAAVGYFVAVNQIRLAVQSLVNPAGQALYPRISAMMEQDKVQAFRLVRRLLVLVGVVSTVLSAGLVLGAPLIVRVVLGTGHPQALWALLWIAPAAMVGSVGNVLGVHTMLPAGLKRAYSRVLLVAGLVNIGSLFLLGRAYGAAGAAAAVLFTEVTATSALGLVVWATHKTVIRSALGAPAEAITTAAV